MSKFQNDAIFWVDVDKIDPNPYQPRRDFNEEGLRDLAESIRQYGVLQPLTVTRNEKTKDDGGLKVYYELIAGERRLRAAKMANLSQVPVTIRDEKEDSEVKLELAIIENLQREDLNPIERAEAFDQLSDEFDFTHKEIAEKIGKSREYVSNSMRLLKLPENVKKAVMSGKISEGHTRPILMLRDKPEKQEQLFKEIIHKDLTVRESEKIARRDAQDKVRKKKNKVDPETKALEDELSDTFGTRVKIEKKDEGGQLVIDFFSQEDLEAIVEMVQSNEDAEMEDMMEKYISTKKQEASDNNQDNHKESSDNNNSEDSDDTSAEQQEPKEKVEVKQPEDSTDTDTGTKQESQEDTSTKQESWESQGGSMAETLGTLIQQAKKERSQSTKESKPDNKGNTEDQGNEEKVTNGKQNQSDKQTANDNYTPAKKDGLSQQSKDIDNEGRTDEKLADTTLPTSQNQQGNQAVKTTASTESSSPFSQNSTQDTGKSAQESKKKAENKKEEKTVSHTNNEQTQQTQKEALRTSRLSQSSDEATQKSEKTQDTSQTEDKDVLDQKDENTTPDKSEDKNLHKDTDVGKKDANDDGDTQKTATDKSKQKDIKNDKEEDDDQDDMYSVSNFSI